MAAVGPGQAAQTAKRSPEFSATYTAIAKRRGKKIATIEISRKLLTRAYHLLAGAGPAGAPAASAPPATAAHPQTGRVTKPRASLPSGMSRPAAGLDLLTEQPGPRTHGHGARHTRRGRRMGACETTPPTTPGDSHTTLNRPNTKGPFPRSR
jgi:hypothetical protein